MHQVQLTHPEAMGKAAGYHPGGGLSGRVIRGLPEVVCNKRSKKEKSGTGFIRGGLHGGEGSEGGEKSKGWSQYP